MELTLVIHTEWFAVGRYVSAVPKFTLIHGVFLSDNPLIIFNEFGIDSFNE